MSHGDSDVESDPSGDEIQDEFCAAPAEHWPIIITFVLLALLATAGVVWLIIKPGAIHVGRIFFALFLAGVGASFVIVARASWLNLHRQFRLHEGGLEYFDGRQWHEITWENVVEIYEVISSVRMLGLTVDAPQFRVAIVTDEGVRCEIDKSVRGSEVIGPIVSGEVNRSLWGRARRKLKRSRTVPFGCVRLSEAGVLVEEPPAKPWWEVVKQRFESNVQQCVVVPGEYAWEKVREIRIASAMKGSRMSDHTTYSELQILVSGRSSPVFSCGVPEFPNFTVFTKVLKELGHPVARME